MSVAVFVSLLATLLFVCAIFWAAAMDLITMTIRNELVLLLLGAYAAFAPLAGIGMVQIAASGAIALGVLIVFVLFFAMGWVGGGDAKLAATLALWLGVDGAIPFLVMTALFGGALTIGLLQLRALPLPAQCLNVAWIARLHDQRSGVPYGVAMAAGALVALPKTPWMAALL